MAEVAQNANLHKRALNGLYYPPHRPSENLDFLLFITVLRAYKAL